MTRAGILEFMRSQSLAVQASVSPRGTPQAAVVGFIVTDDFEIIFDSVDSARKVANLRRNAACAFVIGGMLNGDERTVQVEGIIDEPAGVDLERLKELYSVASLQRFQSVSASDHRIYVLKAEVPKLKSQGPVSCETPAVRSRGPRMIPTTMCFGMREAESQAERIWRHPQPPV